MQFQIHDIADSAAGVQQQMENRSGTDISTQLDFPQQSSHVCPVETFWGELLTPQFLHFPSRV